MPPSLPEDLLVALSQLVESWIGLHIPRARLGDLERGLRAAADEMGWADAEAFTRHLMDAPDCQELEDMLAAHLTIGETYFYRDPRAFEVFENEVLPQLKRHRGGGEKNLRIWSAGCCTGEEPYSLAMAVRRVLGEDSGWKVRILGTDLNPRFLRKASEGIYGPWSFRTLPEDMRDRFFHKHSTDRWVLDDRIKQDVSFSTLNFIDDCFPSPANDTHSLDVIFCRNVLMYFAHETTSKVIAKLRQCLVDGGWLFTGATDGPSDLFTGFEKHDAEGTMVYRRSNHAARAPKPAALEVDRPVPEPVPLAPVTATPPVSPSRQAAIAPPLLALSPPTPIKEKETITTAAVTDLRHEARRMADQGRLSEALVTIDRALECDKLDVLSHYLRGVILHEQNREEEATASLQRALYLDPGFVLAHVTLGNLMRRGGKERAARRCFDNAREILRGHDRDAVLPESGGMTAGRLLHMISMPKEVAA